MDVKEKIAKLRKERGWTLGKLAHEAGISTSAVYNWYNDKNYTPGRDAIEDVCAAFGITQSEFWADVEVDRVTKNTETKVSDGVQVYQEVYTYNNDGTLASKARSEAVTQT